MSRSPGPRLRAGAGRVAIELPAELFPWQGFRGVHDALHARVLLLDGGRRVALVSVEMTSLPEEQISLLRRGVSEIAGLPSENVWICVTHTMSAPHVMPERMCETAADREKNRLLSRAIETAVEEAVSQAVAGLTAVRMGHESGYCDVNANRDVLTAEGWWLGLSETGFSDKTVRVLRLETPDGQTLAVLFSHCVRPAVMERPPGTGDAGLVSADLAGAACALIEQEYGGATTALFFMGAAGDQTPALTGARYQYLGRKGALRVKEAGDGGHAVADMTGTRLGAEVLRVCELIECKESDEGLLSARWTVEFPGQEMGDTRSIRPTREHVFVPGPDGSAELEVIALGEVALVGVAPELCCQTGFDLREQSPFAETLVLTMVNGAAKYMAERSAYERFTYEARNSPFGRGSAEILVKEAARLLRDMAG